MRPSQAVVSASVEAGVASGLAATADMRRTGQWAAQAPNADDVLALEAEIAAKEAAVVAAHERRRRQEQENQDRFVTTLQEEADERREEYAAEDRALMLQLEEENRARQEQRQLEQRQLATQVDDAERKLVDAGLASEHKEPAGEAARIREMPPTDYREPPDLPSAFDTRNNLDEIFDKMQEEEIEAKRMGVTRLEDYEKVKREISAPQLLNERALLAMVGLC